MTKTFEEYLADVEKHGDPFPTPKSLLPVSRAKLIGPNKNVIELKKPIGLNYARTHEEDIIYIEDISENKIFTNDFNNKKFFLHLTENILYIDFNTDYYYLLINFENFPQFDYCQKYKKLTLALLNGDKSDIINKHTSDVNLL